MKRAAALLLSVLCALGQQPGPFSQQPENPGTVFTVTTTLVQVDAVVTDSKGRHVTDLTPDDFELLIGGKPQKLSHFSYVQLAGAAPAAAPARGSKTLPPPPAHKLRPEEVRRTTVLMVDDLGLSFQSMVYVRDALRKFAREQMQPGDLVAVCRTGSGIGAQQRFTSDPRQILALAGTLNWNPNGRYGAGPSEPIGKTGDLARSDGSDFSPAPPNLRADVPSGAAQSRTTMYDLWRKDMAGLGTLASLRYTIDALRDLPGRKSIVVFSDGLTLFNPNSYPSLHSSQGGIDSAAGMTSNADLLDAFRRLIDRANRAGTVIYTVSAQGLQPNQLESYDRVTTNASLGSSIAAGREAAYQSATQNLGLLADKTGGLAFDNGNDLSYMLGKVLEDQQGYYLLAFQPESWLFEKRRGGEAFHSVKIRLLRPGLQVRSRSGFYGETDAATRPAAESALDRMRTAMLSPFESSAVRLRLTALFAQVPKKGTVVRNLLYIDAHDLKWALAPDGHYYTSVSIIASAVFGQAAELATEARTFEFKIPQADFPTVLREGALYTLDVPVKRAGPYQMRVAVRDAATGNTGSSSQFVEIPDLKKAPVALTSVVLRAAGAADRALTQVRRQFVRGGAIEYLSLLLDGSKAKGKAPAYQAQVRLLHDGRQVYAGQAQITDVEGRRAVAGTLKLSDQLPPGDYLLQITAGAPGAQTEQWTDFEITGDGQ